MSKKYGVDQVYGDFLKVYDAADEIFDEEECYSLCSEIDKNYGEDPEYQSYVSSTPILIPFIPLYSVKKHTWLVA